MSAVNGYFLEPLYQYVLHQGWRWPMGEPPGPGAQYSADDTENLWRALLNRPDSQLLGYHAGGFLQPSTWPGFSDCLPSCTSFEQAYRVLLERQQLLATPNFLRESRQGEHIILTVEWGAFSDPVKRHLTEYTLRWLVLLACWLRKPHQWISRIELSHASPAADDNSAYRFFRYALGPQGSLSFSASRNAVVIDRTIYSETLRQATPIPQSATNDIISQATEVIVGNLPQRKVSRASVAAELCMSERTLQRHLEASGTTYGELLRQVRLRQACRLLRETNRQMLDIALEVGFQDPANLFRLFRDQLGTTPALYREQARERASAYD